MSSGAPRNGQLSRAALPHLPASILRPAYDPAATRVGIVHLGPGAFHRAHQAVYIDDLLAAHPDWAICGVSLHSTEVRDALRAQDNLYTLALLGAAGNLRVIGSLRELRAAREEQSAVLARLADPAVRLVTLTVTEKGYCLKGEDLDFAHPEISHDIASPHAPRSAIGHVVAGLAARHASGTAPYTVLSCDNLAGNGHRLRRATLQYAERTDPALARWIEAEVAFPCSMVDSITPATDEPLRERVTAALGCRDAWPIQRESYTQWVIEDRFCNARPPFEEAGVLLGHDIAGYDRAKLRLLNGAHSTLAWMGSLLQLETVGDAMNHPPLARFVERLMRESILPVITLPAGFAGDPYIRTILGRFRNPAIRHLLSQICWDSSQKLPVRLLGTITEALAQGCDVAPPCLAVAAWLQFVRRQARNGVALVDPLNDVLTAIGRACTGEPAADVAAFLKLEAVFGELAGNARFVAALREAYAALGDGSPAAVERALG
ncbi:MAG TPA: mannitol dehydrogenase family protein [Steroidobacteraceae bacterium]|nr:mannitol dehydrogenase family protein [Steroidobacteraceae bacterium]